MRFDRARFELRPEHLVDAAVVLSGVLVVVDVPVDDPLLGRRAPSGEDHDALWVANQLCDLVQLRSTTSGTAVRVHAWTS